jgi:hypothetical protein
MADARAAGVARLIDGLRRDRRQHPLRGRGEYSARVREVTGAIADMIESGRAADAVPLARRAVERVTAAMLHMDDSSGITGDDLRALTALYARGCQAAPPDPKRLAAWLVASRLDGPGWPDIQLADFAVWCAKPYARPDLLLYDRRSCLSASSICSWSACSAGWRS